MIDGRATAEGDVRLRGATLLLGDCLGRMAELPDGAVDLTVTSPPYDNLRTYNGNNEQWGEHVWRPVIEELYRVTAKGGIVVWVVADATINGSETGTSFLQALWAMECGFRLHDTMIYKTNKPPLNGNRYQHEFEYMFVLAKGKPKACNLIKVKSRSPGHCPGKGNRSATGEFKERTGKARTRSYKPAGNVWYIPRSGSQEGFFSKKHPATFPIDLPKWHIISWSNRGDTVLDPFMGSGTTGVAATELGRRFVGIELEQEYLCLARQRIQKEVSYD